MKSFLTHISLGESPTPGQPRSGGTYEKSKWKTKRIPQDEIEQASTDVLIDALKNGGPNNAAIKTELEKRKEQDPNIEIPEPGPEDPTDGGGEGEGEGGGEGEGEGGGEGEGEDNFKNATDDQKKILEKLSEDFIKENKKAIKTVFDNEEVFKLISKQEFENEEQLQTAIKQSAKDIEEAEEIKKQIKNQMKGGGGGDGEGDLPNPPFDPDNLDDKTKNALREFFDTPAGKLFNSFIEAEPAEFPGSEEIKATLMQQLRDSTMEYIDWKLDKEAGVGSSESEKRKRELEKRQRELKKKNKEELEAIVNDPDASQTDKDIAQSILDKMKPKPEPPPDPDPQSQPRSKDELKQLSDEDLQAVIDRGGPEADIAKEIKREREQPNNQPRSKDELKQLSDEDLQAVIDRGGPEADIAKEIKREREQSNNEGYKSLLSTIKEGKSTSNYKSLHTCIKEIWNAI